MCWGFFLMQLNIFCPLEVLVRIVFVPCVGHVLKLCNTYFLNVMWRIGCGMTSKFLLDQVPLLTSLVGSKLSYIAKIIPTSIFLLEHFVPLLFGACSWQGTIRCSTLHLSSPWPSPKWVSLKLLNLIILALVVILFILVILLFLSVGILLSKDGLKLTLMEPVIHLLILQLLGEC